MSGGGGAEVGEARCVWVGLGGGRLRDPTGTGAAERSRIVIFVAVDIN